jgi:hypothetical protein
MALCTQIEDREEEEVSSPVDPEDARIRVTFRISPAVADRFHAAVNTVKLRVNRKFTIATAVEQALTAWAVEQELEFNDADAFGPPDKTSLAPFFTYNNTE